jgi:hypothetical protein
MKTFEDFIKVDDFRILEQIYLHPVPAFKVDDREPDKNLINEFCQLHNLNKDDVWKFHVFYSVHWKVFKNKKNDDYLNRGFETDLMEINEIMKNIKIRKKPLNRISFLIDNATVNIENTLIIDRIIKLIDEEFKGDIWRYHFEGLPIKKTKRSDSYPKEFGEGLKKLFEYFGANNPDLSKNYIYRLIREFLILIDPELIFSLEWIKHRVK